MKKLLLFAIIAVAFVSCSEKKNVDITGKIAGSNGTVIYLAEATTVGDNIIDSLKVDASESFSFSINIDEPTFFKIKSGASSITILANADDKIVVNSNVNGLVDNASIEGSDESSKYLSIVKDLLSTEKKFTELKDKLSAAMISQGYSEKVKNEIDKEYFTARIIHRNNSVKFIQDNSNSLASVFVIYHKFSDGKYVLSNEVDMPFIEMACDSLSKYYPRNKRVELLKKDYSEMEANYKSQIMTEIVNAAEYQLPELLLPNENGSKISLNSLKGKVVLLNFWSYTNQESVANNLVLKSLYKEYKNRGLEIYSVSLDADAEAWKKFIKFDELSWINVIDTNYPNTVQTRTYNVTNVPTFFLIDKKGEIIGRDLPLKRLKIRIEKNL